MSAQESLAAANRILFHQKVVDGFGHVSMRHPQHRDRFLLARSMAPAFVTPDDILEFDLDSNLVSDAPHTLYLERFIHGEIYRAREDVQAVIHSHSPAVVPFSIVKNVTLKPVCHMCGFLGRGAPVFEIRETAGDGSDMLIRTRSLGRALARQLAAECVVLMRGHGVTVVGTTLRQTVFRAVYTELGAKLQSEALRLGAVTYLSPAEAEAASTTNDRQIDRAWDLWWASAQSA